MKQSATKPYHVSAFEIVQNFEKLQTQIDRTRKASVDFELNLNYDEYPKCPESDKKPLTLETSSHSPPNGLSRDSQDMEIDIVINSVELEILEGYI